MHPPDYAAPTAPATRAGAAAVVGSPATVALAAASDTPLPEFLDAFPEQAGLATGRLTEPDEVAAVVAFLASGRVRNVHGADWLVDGGQAKQT